MMREAYLMVNREIPDSDLINLSLNGKKDAWEALLTRYERLIYHAALQTGIGVDEANDVFQAVCLIWIENLKMVRQPEQLGAWLVTITHREVWARWRHDHDAHGDPDDLMATLEDPQESPEQLVGRVEDARMLDRGLLELGEPCAKLLRLLYMDPGHPSYEIISRKMNMPSNSIGPTRGRCLDKLRKILAEHGW